MDSKSDLNLDASQQVAFIEFYNGLPSKPKTTVRFFKRLDNFTVHGEDATLVAGEESRSVQYMGFDPQLSYFVLNRHRFDKIIRELLLVKQYRVEVYISSNQPNDNDWELRYTGSPGNLVQFEELLFENADVVFNSTVLAVKFNGPQLAVCSVDTVENRFHVNEILDNELYTELETILAQVSPRECLIPQGETAQLRQISKILQRNGILIAKLPKADFTPTNIEQDLNRLLHFLPEQHRNAMTKSETNLQEAMGCLQATIKYLHLADDEKNYNQYRIGLLDQNRFVRVDGAAMLALNLLPKDVLNYQSTDAKYMSILGVMDRCCTPQGKRLLEQWIRQPLRDLNLITERLEVTATLVHDSESRLLLTNGVLRQLPDLGVLSKKLASKRVTLQDLYRIYQAVGAIPRIIKILQELGNKYAQSSLVEPLKGFRLDMENYQLMVEKTIDLDLIERGEFLIRPNFEEELQDLYERKQEAEEKMQKTLEKVARELGLEAGKTVKLDSNEQYGYFFRVTLKEEKSLRQNRNFKMLDTVKGGVRFRNGTLTELNESYRSIKDRYQEVQQTVMKEVCDVAAGYSDTLHNLNFYIAKVDVLCSFATVAANAPNQYVKPKLYAEGTGILNLTKVRHPCIELQEGTFVSNDAQFHRDEKLMMIVTGPNMGGKSTYIRSVGVCVLLAHIGSFVPCSQAEISVVDGILARVGADDSLLKGLSTFMMEMVETASILRTATSNSLVIIDELGRGTSTYDGCGLAWSIAEHIVTEIKCFSLYATHFNEVTELANEIPGVSNYHVTAITSEEEMIPLFQVKAGACDKSFGIHCCRMVGFPDDVIQNAIVRQKHLEGNRGMQFMRDLSPTARKSESQAGDQLIEEFLAECTKVVKQSASAAERDLAIQKLKQTLQHSSNLLIKGLLSKSE